MFYTNGIRKKVSRLFQNLYPNIAIKVTYTVSDLKIQKYKIDTNVWTFRFTIVRYVFQKIFLSHTHPSSAPRE